MFKKTLAQRFYTDEAKFAKRCIADRMEKWYEPDQWFAKQFLEENEYLLEQMHKEHAKIGCMHCDHCGEVILALYDDHCRLNWPYFGNQLVLGNTYQYSALVQAVRLYEKWLGQRFDDIRLHVLNSHTKIHLKDSTWDPLLKPYKSVGNFCSSCFRKTYRRELLLAELADGKMHEVSVSVVKDWGEDLQKVCDELGIKKWKHLGNGAIHEY